MDRQTLRDWVHRYNVAGTDGLHYQPRRNGPSPATVAGKPLEIWFVNEARVGQKSMLTYVWARLAEGFARRSRMEWQAEGRRGS